MVKDLDLTVADVRLKPYGRKFEWNRKALETLLGPRYVWIPELGNLNYQNDDPALLADPLVGAVKLRALLGADRRVVLLCTCKDWHTCHRLDVAALLPEFPAQHLTPRDCTARLF